MLLQNSCDFREIWYAVSWIHLLQNRVNDVHLSCIMSLHYPGPDLLSAGTLFRKNAGGPSLIFPRKTGDLLFQSLPSACQQLSVLRNWRPFFCSSLSFTRGCRPLFRYFGHAKNSPLLLWGPLFVGAPVRHKKIDLHTVDLRVIHRVAVGPERTGTPFRFFFGQPERRSCSFFHSSQQCIRKWKMLS